MNFEDSCRPLNSGNEGVLLTAEMDNAEVFPIGFYYSSTSMQDVTGDGIDRYPKIVYEENDILKLIYSDGTVFEVSGTLQIQSPNSFVARSFETDKLLYNSVRFNFIQFFVSSDSNCDNWALDNVQVAVEHGNCSRVLLENYFNESLK